jgi:hypothetical protein
VKNIGKSRRGRKPHARFNEGGVAKAAEARLLRHRQTKGAETDRPGLKSLEAVLYTTLFHSETAPGNRSMALEKLLYLLYSPDLINR